MLNRLLITGAAGGVANLLRPRLVGVSKNFRLTDIRHVVSASDSDEIIIGDLADSTFVDQLVQDCDGILHITNIIIIILKIILKCLDLLAARLVISPAG